MRPDEVRISVALMTHASRTGLAARLRDRLKDMDVRIVVDDGKPVGPAGSLRSARLAWAEVDSAATHHLVVQDDIAVPESFADELRHRIAARPDLPMCLFAEWGAWSAAGARLAALTGAGFAEVVDTYVPTQAVVLPADLARAADERLSAGLDRGEQDDVALLAYLREIGAVAHVCVPNLVEHRDVPSLAGNQDHGLRRSVCFLPNQPVSPAELSRAVTGINCLPYLSWWDGFAVFHYRYSADQWGWRRVLATTVLSRLGLPRDTLVAAFHDTLPASPAASLVGRVSEVLLFHVWLGALSLGLSAAELVAGGASATPTGSRLTLDTPTARQALATLPAGALRRFVPVAQLDTIGRLLEPILDRAVRFGAAWAASAPTRTADLDVADTAAGSMGPRWVTVSQY
ncbi:MAG: hypothetical protein ACJ72N_25115 [Labedaea sp.]